MEKQKSFWLWSLLAAVGLIILIGATSSAPPNQGAWAYPAAEIIDALLEAAQRLKANGGAEHFALLDHAFGLEGERMRQYQLSGARPAPQELRAVEIERAVVALALKLESLPSDIV
jgi:hypothetical protein